MEKVKKASMILVDGKFKKTTSGKGNRFFVGSITDQTSKKRKMYTEGWMESRNTNMAELTGPSEKYGFERKFIKIQKETFDIEYTDGDSGWKTSYFFEIDHAGFYSIIVNNGDGKYWFFFECSKNANGEMDIIEISKKDVSFEKISEYRKNIKEEVEVPSVNEEFRFSGGRAIDDDDNEYYMPGTGSCGGGDFG